MFRFPFRDRRALDSLRKGRGGGGLGHEDGGLQRRWYGEMRYFLFRHNVWGPGSDMTIFEGRIGLRLGGCLQAEAGRHDTVVVSDRRLAVIA